MLARKFRGLLWAVVLLGWLPTGCQPRAGHPLDEEKERHYLAGMSRVHAMDMSGAMESFHKAIEVNPRSAAAHLQLALLYERSPEQAATAIYHFERYLKLRPHSDRADVLRQRIIGCKQELAKTVSLGPLSADQQARLDGLALENQRLKEENRRLADEHRRLQAYFASLQRPLPTQPTPDSGGRLPGMESPPARVDAVPAFSPTAAPETGGALRTHTVQRGETYYSIASRYGVSVAALERANPGVDPRRLAVGHALRIPPR
jgi:tetratricopeptide (TPR) repeat protein